MTDKSRSRAYMALILVCFFWGTTWIGAKKGIQYMPALQLASMRQFIGGVLYLIFFMARGARFPKGKEWGPILILSVLNFMLSNGLSTWGVRYIPAGLASIIGAVFPIWLVVINLVASRSVPRRKSLIGLLIGFTGICVIFYEHLSDFTRTDFQFGIFLSVAATWSWAFGTLYTKKQAANFNPYFSLGLQMIISGIALFSGLRLSGNALPISSIPWEGWAAITYLVIFGSIVSFAAYLYTLQHLSTEQASLYAYVNPIVAVAFGSILFNEMLTSFIIGGTCITLYGVYLVNQSERERALGK